MQHNESKVKVRVNHLTKKFGELLVLDDISFEVKQNEFLCIVGPTGCGKTTFLNSLTKLYDILPSSLVNDQPSITQTTSLLKNIRHARLTEKRMSDSVDLKHFSKPNKRSVGHFCTG